jgi:hypothetical protein
MPRHIRGVTARRSPKPRKRATVAGIPGTSESKSKLFDGLRRAFEAAPEISETPEHTRERYIDAIAIAWPITWKASGPTRSGLNVLTN